MKKLTKILAIVMIACLLCGVVAVSALATFKTDKNDQFLDLRSRGAGIIAHKYQDFNEQKVQSTQVSSGSTTIFASETTLSTILRGYGQIQDGVDKQVLGSSNGDNYIKIFLDSKLYTEGVSGRFTDTGDRGLSNPQFWIDVNNTEIAGGSVADVANKAFMVDGSGLKYQTVDFDLAATEYIFTFGSVQAITDKILTDAEGKKYAVIPSGVVEKKLGASANNYVTLVDGEYRHYVTEDSVYTLSYFSGASKNFDLQPRSTAVTANGAAGTSNIKNTVYPTVIMHEGIWQLKVNKTYVPLSQTAGEWNHITIAIAYKSGTAATAGNNGSLTLTFAYYLNGEFVHSADQKFTLYANKNEAGVVLTRIHNDMSFADIAIPGDVMSSTTATTEAPYFGHAFDNIAITSYTAAYTATADGTFGAYMSSGDYKTKPFYSCSDVVFNNDTYQLPNEVSITETVMGENGEEKIVTTYSMPAKMLADIKFKSNTIAMEIKSPYAILDYTPDESVTGLTIYAPEVTLSEAAEASGYGITDEGDGKWTISRASNSVRIQFYLDEAMTQPIGDVQTLFQGQNPAGVIPAEYENAVVIDGKYYNNAWMITLPGRPTSVTKNFLDITDDDISKFTSSATPLPVVLSVDFENPINVTGYAVEKDGKLLDYSNTTDDIKDAVAIAPNGSTVVLYSDVNFTTLTGFEISAGQQISIDLNGHDLLSFQNSASSSHNAFKIVGGSEENPTLVNIYSSKEGSEVYVVGKGPTYDSSYATISVDGNYYTVNIGKEGEADDGFISFFVGTFISANNDDQVGKFCKECNAKYDSYEKWVDHHGEGEDKIPTDINTPGINAGTRVFNIDGCNINGIMGYSDAVIPLRSVDLKISINKSNIYALTGNIIHHDSRRFAEADVTFKDSNVVCVNYVGTTARNVVGNVPKHVKVTFEGCTVLGTMATKGGSVRANGTITFKGTNYVGGVTYADFKEYYEYDEQTTVHAGLVESKSVTFNLPVPTSTTGNGAKFDPIENIKIPATKTFTFTTTFATVSTDSDVMDEITTVTWMNLDNKTAFKTENWFIGSTVIHPTNDVMKANFIAAQNNGWYDIYYKGWEEKDNSDNKTVANANTVFVCDEETAYPIANVKGIQYNYILAGNIRPIVYSPVVYGADNKATSAMANGMTIPDDVSYIGFVNSKGEALTPSYQIIDGVNRAKYAVSWMTPVVLDSPVNAYIGFTVEGYDGVIIQTITPNFVDYAEAILADKGCGSEEGLLALSIVNYVNNNRNYSASETYEDADAILAAHADCACKTAGEALYNAENPFDNTIAEDDYNHLKKFGVYAVQYTANINQPSLCVYIPLDKVYIPEEGVEATAEDLTKIYSVAFKYTLLEADDNGNLTYIIDPPNEKSTSDIGEKNTAAVYIDTVKVDGADVQMLRIRCSGVTAYNSDVEIGIVLKNYEGKVLTIAGENEGETIEAKAKYSLGEYIEYLTAAVEKETDATKKAAHERALNAGKGLYFYALAARDYKVYTNAEQEADAAKQNP